VKQIFLEERQGMMGEKMTGKGMMEMASEADCTKAGGKVHKT
jgi:hypothetical protein